MLKLQCFVTTVQTSENFTQICTKQTFNSSGGDSGFTALYMTGFVKRGLPHTSNSMNVEDHNVVFKKDTNLKFSPSINLCWCSVLTKFHVNNFFQSQVMNFQSS